MAKDVWKVRGGGQKVIGHDSSATCRTENAQWPGEVI